MVVHDYPVRRRTHDDLEREAWHFRAAWGFGPSEKVDVFDLLFAKMPDALRKLGLKMVERPAGFMGERAAYAAPKQKRIFYRRSLLAQLRLGDPMAAVIFLHELAHVLMHPVGEKAWVISGNQTPKYIAEEESAEWQATTLALCIRAPKAAAIECLDSRGIEQRFGLTAQHAADRFEMLSRQRKRKLPESYYKFKEGGNVKVKSPVSHALPVKNSAYIDEMCSFCGRRLLKSIGCKYICDGCHSISDQFQDGDLVGFELW